MKSEMRLTKEGLSTVIREELSRLRRGIPAGPISEVGCGCEHDQGCCKDKGCCQNKGGCSELFDWVDDRIDILLEYVKSHKEPIVSFFKERGIQLNP
jgi:hypothetical protein